MRLFNLTNAVCSTLRDNTCIVTYHTAMRPADYYREEAITMWRYVRPERRKVVSADSVMNHNRGKNEKYERVERKRISLRTVANRDGPSSTWCCSMKTGLMLQLALLVVLLAGSSEEFFFEYPRKALTEFFQSLRAKKAKVLPKTNVQHYHVHYYPMPFPTLAWTKAPDKYYLDELYGDTLTSLGWSDYGYRYAPDPSLIVSSGLQHLSEPDPWDYLWNEELLGTDDTLDTIDRNSKGILVQVPVNRQLVFHLPLKKSRQRRSEPATT